MTTFLEYPRFPDNVAGLALGGPTYSTSVVALKSGFEQRNQNWSTGRGSWEFPESMEQIKNAPSVIAFFRVVKGRALGFRFRDPMDQAATIAEGTLTRVSAAVYQLYKAYNYGTLGDSRKITKPDATGFAVTRNGGAQAATLDTTTGRVTLPVQSTSAISAITKASPGVVTTTAAHGLITGQRVNIDSVVGMTQANLSDLQVIVLSSTTFSIGIDTASFSTYTSGGTVSKFAQTQDTTVVVALSNVTGTVTKTATTTVPHGLTAGESVLISGIVGLTGVNGNSYIVTVLSSTTFSFVTVSAGGAYVSGGTVTYTRVASDSLAWSGVFDVPCRFDHDDLKIGYNSGGLLDWSGVQIVENLA